MVSKSKHEHTKIISSTPKRTRIRLSRKRRNSEEMARLAEALNESPKVQSVSTNLCTGSLVVYHERDGLQDIEEKLKDVGVILSSAIDLGIPVEGGTESAYSLADAVSDLDRRLGLATSGFLNLRLLVPLGFGILAFLQLMRRGLQLEAAPWYVLAFAAVDSYIKLHHTHANPTPSPADGQLPPD